MLNRLVYQIASMAAVLLMVVSLVFAMLYLAGDPADALVPPGSAPEDVAALRERYGLDEPVEQQYASFLSNALRGDFGVSWRFGQPARDVVFDRLPATLGLVGLALTLS
ncbi:MAG: ABC transporter permease, partial [Thermomicrobiales bacterium]